jgi:hypothetical protein
VGELPAHAAATIGAMGLVVAVLAWGTTRRADLSLSIFIDMLLAAGLLRLAAADTWPAIATAAGFLVVRRLVALRLNIQTGERPG